MAAPVPLAEFGDLIPSGARAALASLVGDELRAIALPGGRGVNLCLRVDTAGRSVVLRLRRGPPLAGANPERELACQRLAASAGLAPAVLAVDVSQGWTLMAHVEGSPWTPRRLHDAAQLRRVGAQLERLHHLPAPDFPPVDGLRLLQANCDLLAAASAPGWQDLLQRGRELTARINQLPARPPVPCHGDPDAANFIGDAPTLVDFEYAQVADATYDLALLLAYFPDLEPQTDLLLSAMGLDDGISRRRLPLQLALCRVINDAWAQACALQGVQASPGALD